MAIQPFHIRIPEKVLADLRRRIKSTRWTDAIQNSGWTFGADLSYMRELAEYWMKEFDWRKTEDQINSYPNYIADIDGYKIHFLYIKGTGKKNIPLILLHGWPGSFLEMIKIIPLLSKGGTVSFDLVIPSLMGFGFSQKVTEPGCDLFFMANLFNKLMESLGYDKYGAHGGDFGSGVCTALGLKYPEKLTGLHLNYIEAYYSPYIEPGDPLTEDELRFLKDGEDWEDREGAYMHQQRTKPLTLSYGLNDSPVGLCAWMIEKFRSWSDCKGDIESVFTKDELLSAITLYWVTGTIHSSVRLYYESRQKLLKFSKDDFIKVPVGIARFPYEEPFPPRKYIERGFNIKHWTEMPAGGHFAAMEQPELIAGDICKFFQSI